MNETIADIIAEMRRFGNRHWMHDEGQNVRMFADRIEAAAKREKAEIEASALAAGGIVEASRHKQGNAAAMREALKEGFGTGFVGGIMEHKGEQK